MTGRTSAIERKLIMVLVVMAATLLLTWSGILLKPEMVKANQAQTEEQISLLILSPTASFSSSSNPTASSQPAGKSPDGFDSTIIGALIGAAATFFAIVYQTRKNSPKTQEESDSNRAKFGMRRARTTKKRMKAYRDALHADRSISYLQILDMTRPLEVTNVYVQVRLDQETRPGYELSSHLLEAEAKADPNELIRAGRLQLESRASAAMDPDVAIHRYKHCVIVGDPGAGKSTLLKYLTLKSIDGQLQDLPDLPIHIELNAFVSSGHQDLLTFTASTWENRYGFPKDEALEYMKYRLKDGKALLLLDALDETVTGKTKDEPEESYKFVANAIMELARRYYDSPIVVTARKASYHQRTYLVGFTELEVLEFRLEDIEQFVNKWFACHPNLPKHANASDLNTLLERNPRILALAGNPLLLSLIVTVYEEQFDLPDRRAELYKMCVDTLLTKWDKSRDIRRRHEFKPEHKRQLLEEIGWHFHLQGQRYFPESELLMMIADFLPAVGLSAEQDRQILDEISAESGLLKEQARGFYGFLHITLQEYFGAQYTFHHNQLDTLLTHRNELWWEEVILLYTGSVPDASTLILKLLGRDGTSPLREDKFHTNLILAGRCLAARPTIRQVSLRDEITSRLLETLTTTPYSLTRRQVAEALAEIGGKVNSHLLRLLANEQLNLFVRLSIVSALGRLGDRSIAPKLLDLLSNEQLDERVRSSITWALGRLGDRSIAPKLLDLLSVEQLDQRVRFEIALVLGSLDDRSIVPDLLLLLSNKQLHPFVRSGIAWALGRLGDHSVVPDLLHLLSNKQLHPFVHQRNDIVLLTFSLPKSSPIERQALQMA